MPKPKTKQRLKFMGGKVDLRALKLAVSPPPAMVSIRLKALYKTFGGDARSLLLDVRPETIAKWVVRGDEIGACSRRAVWTLYGMIYAPHELATLFDYATWGRFTVDPNAKPPTEPPKD